LRAISPLHPRDAELIGMNGRNRSGEAGTSIASSDLGWRYAVIPNWLYQNLAELAMRIR